MTVGVKDVAEKVALKRGCTKNKAEEMVKDVLDCILDAVKEEGGFSYRSQFTLYQKVRKGKTGKVNGKEYHTEDKKILAVNTGKEFEEKLNN